MSVARTFELHTESRSIVLKITDYMEPNHGRSLWLSDLLINQELKNDLFHQRCNYLNFNLDTFCFHSTDAKYSFIPAESVSFVINIHSQQVYYLPVVLLSTLHYIGNVFTDRKLIIVYRYCLHIFDLYTTTIEQLDYAEQPIVSFIAHGDEITLSMCLDNTNDLSEQTIRF